MTTPLSANSTRAGAGSYSVALSTRACVVVVGWLVVLLLLLAFVPRPAAAVPESVVPTAHNPAVIDSIDFEVRVTYLRAVNLITQVLSNRVHVDVMSHWSVELAGNGDRVVVPGGIVSFMYKLTNAGNVVDSFALTETLSDGAGFTTSWWYDIDENGRLSAADIPVSDYDGDGIPDTGPLSPGMSRRLLLVVGVPEEAAFEIHTLEVAATSTGDPSATATWTNRLEVSDAAPYISLEGAPDIVYEGDEFVLPIHYGNDTGTQPVSGAVITLQLSPWVDYVSSDPSAVYDPERHELVWEIGEIPGGHEDGLYVTLRAHEGLGGDKMLLNRGRLVHSGNLVLEGTGRTRLVTAFPYDIEIVVDPGVIRADGKESTRISAGIVDMIGNPVADGTLITIEAELGSIVAGGDARPCEGADASEAACVQVPTRNGVAMVDLIGPRIDSDEPVAIKVRVSAWNPDVGLVTESVQMYFSPGAIVGRLIDHATNLPEAGVEVHLIRLDENGSPIGNPIVRYTDENGYYIFPVPEGRYIIVVYREGEALELPQIEVEEAYDSITFAPIIIRGHLIDRETGLGFPGAIVDLFDEQGRLLDTTVTDEEGGYLFIITPQHLMNLGVGDEFFALADVGDYTSLEVLQRPQWRIRARTEDGRGAEYFIVDVRPGDMRVNLLLWVEPMGLVYDLETGRPIAGAEVTLAWGGPPIVGDRVVLPMHLGVPQPNPLLTDDDGTYQFHVKPGYYLLEVKAEGYRDHLTAPMVVNGNRVAVEIGLEPAASGLIDLTKVAMNPHPRPGDALGYAVEVTNRSGDPLTAITVVDWLPDEVEYVPGSANAGGLYDPSEHAIVWQISELAADRSTLLHYEVIVGDVASGSILTNLARGFVAGEAAFATAVSEVMVAHWPVLVVTKEVDQEEAAIGDVLRYRIVVENQSESAVALDTELLDVLPAGFVYAAGSTIIDGASGVDPVPDSGGLLWAFGDILPGERRELQYAAVVTLEASGSDGVNRVTVLGTAAGGFPFQTAPATARTRVTEGLFGHLGRILGRVFVDLNGNGEPDPGEPGLEGVEVILDDGRRALTGAHGFFSLPDVAPGMRSLKLVATSLPHGVGPGGDGTSPDPAYDGADPSRGGWSHFASVLPGGTAVVDFGVALGENLPIDPRDGGEGIIAGEVALLEALADLGYLTEAPDAATAGAGSTVGLPRIVSPDPYTLSFRQGVSVTVEGAWGKPLQLLVNGEPVSESAIGRRVEDPGAGQQELTFYGVSLQVGVNYLTAVSGDARHEIIVVVVGPPHSVQLVEIPAAIPYRAERHVPITLQVADALGVAVEDGTVLTVVAEGGRVLNRDLNPTQPGVQMATVGGRLYVDLGVAGDHTGAVQVRVTSGPDEWVLPIETHFLPEPQLLVGTLNLIVPFDGTPSVSGSLYYRQGWDGDRRLGLRYNSHRPAVEQGPLASLLASRPVDSAQVDDLAPSSAPLYLRFEWGSSYVLFGDYSPQANNPNRFTQRTGRVTGWDGAWVSKMGVLSAYHFPQRHATRHAVLPGMGISGLYHLPDTHVLPGSEEVKIVAYHADDAERRMPLDTVTVRRDVDYEIDYASGAILFREPIPSLDAQFRRLFIEVVYAVEDDTATAGAFGLRYQLPEFGGLRLALSYAGERGEKASRPTYGVDGRLHLTGAGVGLDYSVGVQPASDGVDAGRAGALQLSWHPTGSLRLQLRMQHVAGEFVQPGHESPLKEGWTLNGGITLGLANGGQLQYERQSDLSASGGRHSDRLELSTRLGEVLAARISLSSSGPEANPLGATRPLNLGVGLDWTPSDATSLTWQREFALKGGAGGPAPTTFTYQQRLTPDLAASLRYQLGGSGTKEGVWLLSLESNPVGGAQLYGRYRLPLGAESDQLILGLRNRWELLPGLAAGLRVESIVDLSGGTTTAGSWQLEYVVGPLLRLTLQQEFRLTAADRQGTWRFGAEGSNGALSYQLGWMWLQGGSKAADGRALLQEFVASVLYRDPATHRGYVVGELVQRTFAYDPIGGFGRKTTRESLALVEAGLRVTTRWSLSAKVGLKQNVTSLGVAGVEDIRSSISLQQLGLEYAWEQYTLQAFARKVQDQAGPSNDGFAIELVRYLTDDVGVGLGYSSLPLDDPDLRRLMEWPEGVYTRLVWKF